MVDCCGVWGLGCVGSAGVEEAYVSRGGAGG